MTIPEASARSMSSVMTSSTVMALASSWKRSVSSSSGSEPSARNTFMPFHSGGLWLEVMITP
jgi:hypothetical protein